jgi:FkbM family methyltransferase
MDSGIRDNFWKDVYPTWKNETFDIFEKYLTKDKQFLEIGAWIGASSLYAGRLSSYVVCVEPDPSISKILQDNIKTNCLDTIFNIENCAICNEITQLLGNISNSTYPINKNTTDLAISNTITFNEIIEKYKLNNLSLIKVDIGGTEEDILNNLLEYSNTYKVPIYISFYYERWNDKNLNRFSNLNEYQKENIISSPCSSILFDYSISQ